MVPGTVGVVFILLAAAGLLAVDLSAQGRVQRPMTFEDFAAVRNVGDPQVSPDGRWLLYSVRTTDVSANRRTTVTKVQASGGGAARQFPNASTAATEARWSPDGKRIAYIAGGQLWIADASGANARKISSVSGGASGPVWAPTGDHIAFVTGVYPDCDSDGCNIERAKAADTGKVRAHIADNLLYRHWTEWTPATRSHLFVVSPDGKYLAYPYQQYSPPVVELAVIPSGGGNVVNKFQVPGFLGTLRWSPDGKPLHYVLTSNGASNIWKQSLSALKPKQLTHFNSDEIFDFSWTADHEHLLMTRGQSKRDVILLSHLRGE